MWFINAMLLTTPVLTGAAVQGSTPTAADALADTPKSAASWVDISSRVGVVAVVLFAAYLLIFSGRLRSDREFKELTATHKRELDDRDARIADLKERNLALFSDRDAWKLAAGNALQGLQAFERSTAATLEEKSMVIAVVEALQQIAQQQHRGGGSAGGGG